MRRASLHPSAAWPAVHCFAYARGTADHKLVSGASVSEANRGRRCAKPSDTGMTTQNPVTTRTNVQILPIDKHPRPKLRKPRPWAGSARPAHLARPRP